MAIIRDLSDVLVLEVFAYKANYNNAISVSFIIIKFILRDIIINSFSRHFVYKGKTS
jgi:hypothetical protein